MIRFDGAPSVTPWVELRAMICEPIPTWYLCAEP